MTLDPDNLNPPLHMMIILIRIDHPSIHLESHVTVTTRINRSFPVSLLSLEIITILLICSRTGKPLPNCIYLLFLCLFSVPTLVIQDLRSQYSNTRPSIYVT